MSEPPGGTNITGESPDSEPTVETDEATVTDDAELERILEFSEKLVGGRQIGVTLFYAGEATDEARSLLAEAADRFGRAGIDARTELATDDPFDELVDAVAGHDAIVMAEQAPSMRSLLFGGEAERVASASVGPVLVVQSPPESEE
jgi:nucleotide-binding universal stress UspA family protein